MVGGWQRATMVGSWQRATAMFGSWKCATAMVGGWKHVTRVGVWIWAAGMGGDWKACRNGWRLEMHYKNSWGWKHSAKDKITLLQPITN